MRVINDVQEEILKVFGEVKDSGLFYLTGGTALAFFYLQHRQSQDLDFFSSVVEIIEPFSRQLEEYLIKEGFECKRQRSLDSFVELIVSREGGSTLIHLALDAAFCFEPVREFSEFPRLKVGSLTDIASNKLLALFGRATLRDFIDVYFLIKKGHFDRERLIELAVQKDPGFDLYWLSVAFERIHSYSVESADMLLLLEPVNFKNIKEFFIEWRQEISKDLKI